MSTPGPGAAAASPPRPKRAALDEKIGDICLEWWAQLNAVDPKTGNDLTGKIPDRAAIAALRRIGTVEGSSGPEIDTTFACGIPGREGRSPYLVLHSRLRGLLAKWQDEHVRRIPERTDFDASAAVVAATLARVRANRRGSLVGLLGAPRRDEQPVMAEARFKRLIRTTSPPDLLDQGRRIVMLLGREVPVADLGASLLLWNVDPLAKRRWAFGYFGAEEMSIDGADDKASAEGAAPDASI